MLRSRRAPRLVCLTAALPRPGEVIARVVPLKLPDLGLTCTTRDAEVFRFGEPAAGARGDVDLGDVPLTAEDSLWKSLAAEPRQEPAPSLVPGGLRKRFGPRSVCQA